MAEKFFDTTPETLKHKTRVELLTLLSALQGEVAEIKGQIQMPRVPGAGADWRERAIKALRTRSLQTRQVQTALALQRCGRQQVFHETFMAMAKSHLGDALYDSICEAAERAAQS